MPNMSPFAEVSVPTARKPGRKLRISARVKHALSLMVNDGRSRKDAAQIAGLSDHGLYQALSKPHVKAYRNKLLADLRESEAARSIARVASLADGAQSEHVRLESNKWLAGLDGVSPVQRSEQHVTADVRVTPGYVIDLGSASAPVIEGEGQEVQSSADNGRSVPHDVRQGDGTPPDVDGG